MNYKVISFLTKLHFEYYNYKSVKKINAKVNCIFISVVYLSKLSVPRYIASNHRMTNNELERI
jgi:hypothetical protein